MTWNAQKPHTTTPLEQCWLEQLAFVQNDQTGLSAFQRFEKAVVTEYHQQIVDLRVQVPYHDRLQSLGYLQQSA